MDDSEILVAIGKFGAQIQALQESVEELRVSHRAIQDDLSAVQGSWKVLVALGGVASAVGAALHSAFESFQAHLK